ncbi:MAG: arylesterase, partial [Pseudomonadota bacterium]
TYLLLLAVSIGATEVRQPSKLLVLGDSLSAGYGISMRNAWPSLLQNRLRDLGSSYEVVNASISGETTKGGLSRIGSLLKKHRPAVVIVELGANDGLRGVPAAHAKENLQQIIEKSVEEGSQVLLFEMKIPPNYGNAFAEQYQRVYDELGQLDQVLLVPFFLAEVIFEPNMMQSDGLHPTKAAQPVILETVWPYVTQVIGQVSQVGQEGGLQLDELSPY